ncbi:hypothetical protein [Methanosarcina horonobensis]|uniref:hypothetical protein n=1 Tax=Methanosarcina horonobensis TaxID=418008 RepID=UPI000A7750F4|nr:hypothetical protein [Methanosarcina horonobensis]
MLKLADIVVITKGDIVSQAEREVFAYRVRQVNPRGMIVQINGVTGQGSFYLAKLVEKKLLQLKPFREPHFDLPCPELYVHTVLEREKSGMTGRLVFQSW